MQTVKDRTKAINKKTAKFISQKYYGSFIQSFILWMQRLGSGPPSEKKVKKGTGKKQKQKKTPVYKKKRNQ